MVALLVLAFTAGEAAAKKQTPAPRTITVSKTTSEPIPQATASSAGLLTSTLEIAGKKLRNTQVRDVNLTLQTTGSAPGAPSQLLIVLTSPSGATVTVVPIGLGGQSIGPLRLDDESDVALNLGNGPARDTTFLAVPYQGTAQPTCAFSNQGCALSAMDYSPPVGTWTLRAYDVIPGGPTSVLDGWSLEVIAGKKFRTGKAAKKEKKNKTGGLADITLPVNAPVPDATATTNGQLRSIIPVAGKRFRDTRIRDVNVTFQTTGSAAGSGSQLTGRLISPKGSTVWLFGGLVNAQSIGPMTLDDESFVSTISAPPRDPTQLGPPYQGTAQPNCFLAFGQCSLSVLDAGPVSGNWTLLLTDTSPSGPATSTLVSWRLQVVAGKRFRR